MSGINQIKKTQESWQSEGKLGGGGTNLFLRDGDIALCHFVGDGAEGDPYFEVFMSHEYPAQQAGQYRTLKMCPVESGFEDNYDCPGCKHDIKVKPQMAMWFFVSMTLHKDKKPEEQLEMGNFQGQQMWVRRINDVKLWETSAWRESCLGDIEFIYRAYGDSLHGATMALKASGNGMNRRYQIFALPNSQAVTAEMLGQWIPKVEPVRALLMRRLSQTITVSAAQAAAEPGAPGSVDPLAAFRPIVVSAPAPMTSVAPGEAVPPIFTPSPVAMPTPLESTINIAPALPGLVIPPNAKSMF